jgi:hypothetical protein
VTVKVAVTNSVPVAVGEGSEGVAVVLAKRTRSEKKNDPFTKAFNETCPIPEFGARSVRPVICTVVQRARPLALAGIVQVTGSIPSSPTTISDPVDYESKRELADAVVRQAWNAMVAPRRTTAAPSVCVNVIGPASKITVLVDVGVRDAVADGSGVNVAVGTRTVAVYVSVGANVTVVVGLEVVVGVGVVVGTVVSLAAGVSVTTESNG